jgi:hypothetical protein
LQGNLWKKKKGDERRKKLMVGGEQYKSEGENVNFERGKGQ